MSRLTGWALAVCVLGFCICLPALAQRDDLSSLGQRATKAYQTKDYASFLVLEKQALALAPQEPRIIYNVACGEALAGHAVETVHMLDELIGRGMDMGADNDPDFTNIHNSTEWKQFKERLEALRKPHVRSTVAFRLPEKGLMATSVAVDEQTGDIYIASARQRKIVRRTKDGVVSDFATEKDGLLAVSYLLIDPTRKQLIASVAGVPFMTGYSKEDAGRSGVLVFDLGTGKVLRKAFVTAEAGHAHILAAMVLDKSGNLFVVDNGTAEIYRLRRLSSELELFVSSVVYPSPQSLALSADERTLYVVDYKEGLWAMEILSADRRHIDSAPEVFMPGLLGLAPVKDGFVGVQHGIQPNRVVRLHMDTKGERITSLETLESNHPDYDGPTQGTIVGGDFLYIANSQIGLLDPKTGMFPENRANATAILRLPLGN